METLRWDQRPVLRRPILVAAFEGWNDAADAASSAVDHLARVCGARPFASIDAEDFFDFTSTRPVVRLDDELSRRIEWPANEFLSASLPDLAHDLVLLSGTEPQLRWRGFCGLVGAVVDELDVELVVTLGALLADVPHTQPVRVTGTAAEPDLAERLHLTRSRYEGPTGIVGVLTEHLRRADVPAASLWASVPHYVGQTPSPKATLALVERTASLLGIPAEATDLEMAASAYERQVTDLVEADPDVAEYVAQLEREGPDEIELELEPDSAESLAAEVERFLRDHGPR